MAVFDRDPARALTQKAGTAGCVSETGTGGECADGKALAAARSVTLSADGKSAYVVATQGVPTAAEVGAGWWSSSAIRARAR